MNENITRVSLDEVLKRDRTDWTRVATLSDREIDQAIANDPDTFAAAALKPGQVRYVVIGNGDGRWHWCVIDSGHMTIARSVGEFRSQQDAQLAMEAVRKTLSRAAAA